MLLYMYMYLCGVFPRAKSPDYCLFPGLHRDLGACEAAFGKVAETRRRF